MGAGAQPSGLTATRTPPGRWRPPGRALRPGPAGTAGGTVLRRLRRAARPGSPPNNRAFTTSPTGETPASRECPELRLPGDRYLGGWVPMVTYLKRKSMTDGRDTLTVVDVDSGRTRQLGAGRRGGQPQLLPPTVTRIALADGWRGTSGLYLIDLYRLGRCFGAHVPVRDGLCLQLQPAPERGMDRVRGRSPATARRASGSCAPDGTDPLAACIRASRQGMAPGCPPTGRRTQGGLPTFVTGVWRVGRGLRFQLWDGSASTAANRPWVLRGRTAASDDWPRGPEWSPDGRVSIAFGVHVGG